MKDYLGTENSRNKKYAKLYEDLIKTAFGEDNDVLIGHHLTFEHHGDISTENEIPSADTLIFCHDLMTRVFGEGALHVMHELAALPVGARDERLSELYHEFVEPAPVFVDTHDTSPYYRPEVKG